MCIDFSNRISQAKIYLDLIKNNVGDNWMDLYENYKSSNCIYEKLLLIHPEHFTSLKKLQIDQVQKNVQNQRLFTTKPVQEDRCNSKLIWGYDCDSNDLVNDHFFPYSLGGITSETNQLVLCKYHNMVKTSDIHLLPWELSNRFSWVDKQIDKIFNKFLLDSNQS